MTPLRQPFPTETMTEEMAIVLRAKTGSQRLAIADGMWRSARRMVETMFRREHPEWSDEQLQQATARRLSHGTV